ncbi:hypothetical protein EK599_04420 [Vibrio sp. T187]|uniref:hypothetical protein n=1 Tax=Vibrio TaxID=662 RepID=UPI0010C93B17|nr:MULTISPECIES: hypothetical protein [Vibrio]MBW3694923.1 hypothetical protein [Vibrio sp. T187]
MNAYKLFLLSFTLVALTLPASANDESIERCTRFLPEGQKFEITITGISDSTKGEPNFEGSFSVDGGTEDINSFDIGDFVECVGPLIKMPEPTNAN